MSTQDQNTPQQKDARPRWARLHKKTPASGEEPLHYSKADMLKQSNIWFRKQGVPLIIPARQRALDAFPRSVPWILWAGIMHICYIFLRDILLFVVEDVKGSLPNYIKALTSDSALSNEVLPVLVLGGIFLVMPIISGAFIALAHMLMVRTPQWVQITTGILTLLFAGMLFTTGVFEASTLEGIDFVYDGGQVFPLIVIGIYLAIFLGVDTVLGWSLKHAIHQLASLSPMIAKVLPVLMVSVLFIFVNADLWKLANGLSFPRTWAVLGLMGLLAVFVVVTTSLERTARLLGRNRGDDIARFSESDYEHAAALEGGIWNTAQDWVEEKKILEHRPLKTAPWGNLIIIPMIGQIIQATLFMMLVFGFFMGFSSIAISDTTIESWMTVKPEHLKILGVDTNINAVVIKVSMIVAVFSGLSFVATTSSDEKYARSFLKPMIARIKHILVIRDIYLGLLTMPKNEVLIPLSEEERVQKEPDKA
ncbi:D-mannonate dehydratase [Rothia mucilaginosa]|uniref:D-mannonate dehydratase n=1 Tax=Rothia mucilaginosa TaxID=43675 RepID=UPI001C59C504|nr:D-mannonate dehydratase [Rothia mucilaginosa]QXW97651.1 D-mannonate dehydratase [Rothia mucilaginosa]